MRYSTINKSGSSPKEFPIWYNAKELLEEDIACSDRFKLVLLEEGTIECSDFNEILIAPSLICLSELEQPKISTKSSFKASSLYFHPQMTNSMFSFEVLRKSHNMFQGTTQRDRSSLRAFFDKCDSYSGCFTIDHSILNRIKNLFYNIDQELTLQEDSFWLFRTRALLLELIYIIQDMLFAHESKSNPTLDNTSPAEIKTIVDYLTENYDQKITLDELERRFCFNRTTLNKMFLKEAGLPIISFLIQLRIKEAAKLLKNTNLKSIEIMEKVGYRDYKHFSSTFKKFVGFTPTKYRQKSKNKKV